MENKEIFRDAKGRFVKGNYYNYGFKKGMISWNKGISCSEKSKDKIRNSNYHKNLKGKNHPMYGKKHKEKTLELMSLAKKGKPCEFIKTKFKKGHITINILKLDKELIEELYLNKNKSIKEIAKICNCNYVSILNKLKEMDIFKKNKNRKESKYWKDKSFSNEHKVNLKIAKLGKIREDANNWQGGLSFEPYTSDFNNQFKDKIRQRDNQICMICGIHREKLKKALCIHHINYDKQLTIPQNCISLCDICHLKTNSNRKHWTKFFQSLLSERYEYKYNINEEIVLEVKQND